MSGNSEVKRLLGEAAKFYAAKDYEKSTNLYSEVNALHDALKGESNADYLFLYGKSLYQLALSQSDVFGGEQDEEEGEDADDEGHDSKKKELYQFSAAVAEGEDADLQPSEEPGQDEGAQDALKEQEDDDEQPEMAQTSDFESAWELLELARSLYEKQSEGPATIEKLSETYDILGEISLETENFPQAKQDFAKSLELRLKAYAGEDPAHRLIIESHYKLSLALEFDPSESTQCQQELEKAIALLELRIKDGKAEKDDQGLLEELKLKFKELKLTEESLETIKQQSMAQIKSVLSGTAPVNDLTSMVKKRKPKQPDVTENEHAKKPKK
ncbi:LADA_0F09010g1_1 [Lachancea dasiensis]|uniref:LADA_0F09010g1_1 n=1 Tax=Lachancea dasiensis TaxID=1072105 RepID=A0A1G4JLI4_9SACH|nr:LADA_0F09010g1_1 [Lachancea dasiensis]